MPAIALEENVSTGHGCWPPTGSIGPYANATVRANGKRIQIRGKTLYAPHTCNKTTHSGNQRMVLGDEESTIFISGEPVAMVGDLIACGDRIGRGSPDVFGGE